MIILATSNLHKFKEIKLIAPKLDLHLFSEFVTPFEIEENGASFKENAFIKACAVAKSLNMMDDFFVLSEDSGLCVDGLGGEPNIFSARYAEIKGYVGIESSYEGRNIECLINELEKLGLSESSARFEVCMCLFSSNQLGKGKESLETIDSNAQFFYGVLRGRVITQKRGENGFGYDPIFIPHGYEKTFAEIAEKNTISHRFLAMRQLLAYLQAHKIK